MLKLKPSCEPCDKPLLANSTEAMICSFECTFCCACVENVLLNVCPNCGGGFASRPIRTAKEYFEGVSLKHYPASSEKVLKPVNEKQHQLFAQAIKKIPAEDR